MNLNDMTQAELYSLATTCDSETGRDHCIACEAWARYVDSEHANEVKTPEVGDVVRYEVWSEKPTDNGPVWFRESLWDTALQEKADRAVDDLNNSNLAAHGKRYFTMVVRTTRTPLEN